MLFQPCRSCSLLMTLKMSCSVSKNKINDDDDNLGSIRRATYVGNIFVHSA